MIHRTVVKTSNIEITANVDTALADAPSRCCEKLEKRWQPKTIANDKRRQDQGIIEAYESETSDASAITLAAIVAKEDRPCCIITLTEVQFPSKVTTAHGRREAHSDDKLDQIFSIAFRNKKYEKQMSYPYYRMWVCTLRDRRSCKRSGVFGIFFQLTADETLTEIWVVYVEMGRMASATDLHAR